MRTNILIWISLLAAINVFGQYIGQEKLYYGASYYPESWPMEQVDEDIRHMKELSMNVVRMAEFSWSKMEPEEGEYDFEWLHTIIEKLHANGIDVILGTPTATPPAWLWQKHPEIGIIDEQGRQRYHGARKDYSYSSEIYRQYVRKIVSRMAQEFGDKPGVIGWQVDNELSPHSDYSDETKARWHQWLKKKYGTIDNLNQKWATELWSQTYQNFDQIPMPRSWIWHHNSLKYEWKRFNNDMVNEFMDMQMALIREHSDLPITHDTMPGQSTDYEGMMDDADFMAVNNYHSFEAYDRVFSNYDRMRGFGKGYHWLFETAPNNSGGGKEGKMWFLHQPEGSMHAALWMNFALGGQGSLFWLWRQHRAGQEMVHGSIINAWGKKAANYDDLKKLGADLAKSSDFLMKNFVTPAEVAIIYSNEADMGFDVENYVNDIHYYTDWTYRFYHSLSDIYIHRDVIGVKNASLDPYKIVFAPLLNYVPQELRDRLKAWVRNGGTLVFGPVSGYRTDEFTFFTDHAYGNINDWSGIEVESRIPIGLKKRPQEVPLHLEWTDKLMESKEEATLWSDALSSEDGEVWARYNSGMHKNEAAVIVNKVGKGKVVILGTDPGKESLHALFTKLAADHEIDPLAEGDHGVVVAPRGSGGEITGLVVDNIYNEEKAIRLKEKGPFVDILTGETYSEEMILKPFQVLVLKKK